MKTKMLKTSFCYLLKFYLLIINISVAVALIIVLTYCNIGIVNIAIENRQEIINELDINKMQYFIVLGSIFASYVIWWFVLRILNRTPKKNRFRGHSTKKRQNSYFTFNAGKEHSLRDHDSDYKPEESLSSYESMDSVEKDKALTKKFLQYASDKPIMQVYKDGSGEPCELDSDSEPDDTDKLDLTEEQIAKMDPETKFTARAWYHIDFQKY